MLLRPTRQSLELQFTKQAIQAGLTYPKEVDNELIAGSFLFEDRCKVDVQLNQLVLQVFKESDASESIFKRLEESLEGEGGEMSPLLVKAALGMRVESMSWLISQLRSVIASGSVSRMKRMLQLLRVFSPLTSDQLLLRWFQSHVVDLLENSRSRRFTAVLAEIAAMNKKRIRTLFVRRFQLNRVCLDELFLPETLDESDDLRSVVVYTLANTSARLLNFLTLFYDVPYFVKQRLHKTVTSLILDSTADAEVLTRFTAICTYFELFNFNSFVSRLIAVGQIDAKRLFAQKLYIPDDSDYLTYIERPDTIFVDRLLLYLREGGEKPKHTLVDLMYALESIKKDLSLSKQLIFRLYELLTAEDEVVILIGSFIIRSLAYWDLDSATAALLFDILLITGKSRALTKLMKLKWDVIVDRYSEEGFNQLLVISESPVNDNWREKDSFWELLRRNKYKRASALLKPSNLQQLPSETELRIKFNAFLLFHLSISDRCFEQAYRLLTEELKLHPAFLSDLLLQKNITVPKHLLSVYSDIGQLFKHETNWHKLKLSFSILSRGDEEHKLLGLFKVWIESNDELEMLKAIRLLPFIPISVLSKLLISPLSLATDLRVFNAIFSLLDQISVTRYLNNILSEDTNLLKALNITLIFLQQRRPCPCLSVLADKLLLLLNAKPDDYELLMLLRQCILRVFECLKFPESYLRKYLDD